MYKNKAQKVFVFAQILAFLLIVIGIIIICGFILSVFYPNYLSSETNESLKSNYIYFISVALYCLVGGVGLYRLKKWALYFVACIGVYEFFWIIFWFLFTSNFTALVIAKIFLGLYSIYLLRNRQYFNNEKIQSRTT